MGFIGILTTSISTDKDGEFNEGYLLSNNYHLLPFYILIFF